MRQKNVEIPPYFRCPISFELMKDPVTLSTGITYERASIQKWLEDGNKACPVTRQVLQSYELIPNYTLHHLMKSWCSSRRPLIDDDDDDDEDGDGPSKKEEVGLEDFLQRIRSKQDVRVLDMDYKTLRTWSKCSLEHGIWKKVVGSEGVLGVLMSFLARNSCESDQLKGFPGDEEALSIVVRMCQLDGKIRRRVADSSEFHVMLRFLHSSKSSTRLHAAKLLENLVSEDDLKVKIGALSACVEGLLGLLKPGASSEVALCRDSTEAALKCLLSICTPFKNKLRVIRLGAVNVLIQLLSSSSSSSSSAQAQKHIAEHALALLKLLSTCAEGRAAISQVHNKAMPAILDSLLRVSSQATEHGILILWACFCLLGAAEDVEDSFMEADGLSKLVMVLQCDCTVVTKQKAGELLKQFSWVWKDIGPPATEKSTSAAAAAASGADCSTLVDKKHKSPTKSHAAAR